MALLSMAATLAFTVMHVGYFIAGGEKTFGVMVSKGVVYFGQYFGDWSALNSSPEFQFRWASPRIGEWLQFFDEGNIAAFEFGIPLWIFLVLAAAWIAFREWRRKRAAEGEGCRQ